VVFGVVNGVDTDRVDTERLEVGDIAPQVVKVEQRVSCISRTTSDPISMIARMPQRSLNILGVFMAAEQRTWLVSDTSNVESVAASEEGISSH